MLDEALLTLLSGEIIFSCEDKLSPSSCINTGKGIRSLFQLFPNAEGVENEYENVVVLRF